MRKSPFVGLCLVSLLPLAASAADFSQARAAIASSFAGLPGADEAPAAPVLSKPLIVLPPRVPLSADASMAQPDWSFTPGKLCTADDPNFLEYRYAEQVPVCRRNVTEQMKQEVAAHYGVPKSDWGNYEFDHLIPLAIGGNSSVDNLWPEPHGADGSGGSQDKDKLEDQLYHELDNGQITQAEAVRQIYAWFGRQSAFQRLLQAARARQGAGS